MKNNYNDSEKLFQFGSFYENNLKFDFINLAQICEVALIPGGEIPEHEQICSEISYIVSGSGVFCTNGIEYEMRRGDIHVIAKGDSHRITASQNEKLRYICIGFTFEKIPEKYSGICRFYEKSPEGISNCNSDIRNLFDMLIGEFYILQEDRSCVIEDLLKLIFAKVYRCFSADCHQKQFAERGMERQNIVYRIVKYIDNNIYSVKAGDISKKLHYTESYISAVFKQKMGITLQTYIREKKLETAKMLLEHGNLTAAEVSELMHFDSVQSFSKSFKNMYGVTPHKYLSEKRKASLTDKKNSGV